MGLPSLQALGWLGGALCFCQTFFGGGLENYLGRGVGSGVSEGVLFLFHRCIFIRFLCYWTDEMHF